MIHTWYRFIYAYTHPLFRQYKIVGQPCTAAMLKALSTYMMIQLLWHTYIHICYLYIYVYVCVHIYNHLLFWQKKIVGQPCAAAMLKALRTYMIIKLLWHTHMHICYLYIYVYVCVHIYNHPLFRQKKIVGQPCTAAMLKALGTSVFVKYYYIYTYTYIWYTCVYICIYIPVVSTEKDGRASVYSSNVEGARYVALRCATLAKICQRDTILGPAKRSMVALKTGWYAG